MTERVQVEAVEKSAEEQLADVIKSETAAIAETKADATTVAELKAEVEALTEAKSQVEAATAELKADTATKMAEVVKAAEEMIETKLNSIPGTFKKEVNPMEFKSLGEQHNGSPLLTLKLDTLKAVTDNTNIDGAPITAVNAFYTLQQANPFRAMGTILPSSSGVIRLPEVSGITWASEATQPLNSAPRTEGGTNGSTSVIIETWVSQNSASIAALNDVPGMDAAISGLMVDQLGLAEAADGVAVVKAFDFADAREITTGVATGFPASDDIFGKTVDLITGVSAAYRPGAAFLMSRGYFSALQQSNNNGINFNPMTGLTTVAGYPVSLVDALEDDSTDGNLTAIFGNIARGVALGTASEISISRFDQTNPGAITYFGHSRFKHAIWDSSAISTMKIGA